MSARRRGQARGNAGGNAPDGSNQQGRRGPNPNRGRVAPFDGPASRGSGSGGGAQSLTSGPQSSRPPSQPGSNAGQSQTSAQPQPAAQPAQQVAAPVARDPALEISIVRATDSIRNVDMPASFYNIDNLVSHTSLINPNSRSHFDKPEKCPFPSLICNFSFMHSQ